MKKTAYSLILLPAALALSMAVAAQQDSSFLDLGGVRLQKQFTQYISIKGAALEKMPFANLAEAINTWLYGAYSNASTLVYVVDGNIVPDVNAWSVYDIAEVVLPQTALTQVTGNTGQQQLVLITTRRKATGGGKGPLALNVAGASAMANTDYKHIAGLSNASSGTAFYHQYHISGYYTREKIQLGVSAGWLRDVLPPARSDTTKTSVPAHFNRYRFNAWMNWRVGRINELYLSINATPEQAGQRLRNTSPNITTDIDGTEKQLAFTPYLQLRTRILPGLQNQLSATYQVFNSNSVIDADQNSTIGTPPVILISKGRWTDTTRDRIWVIRDQLSWTLHARDWTIQPAVYAQYAYLKQRYNSLWVSQSYTGGSTFPPATSASYYYTGGKGHIFTGAPSIDFSYKQLLSFGGGGLAYLPPKGTTVTKSNFFPFAHLSFDFLKLGNPTAQSSLQLFAAFARNYGYSFSLDALDDLTGASLSQATQLPVGTSAPVFYGSGTVTQLPTPSSGDLYEPHAVWTAGLGFRGPGDKLTANYYFEKRGFTAPMITPIPIGTGFGYTTTFPPLQAYTHHVNVMARIADGGDIQWQSGITVTNITVKGTLLPPYPTKDTYAGDVYGHHSWTGGWINRIGYRRFFAGLDVLYHIGEYQPTSALPPYQYKKINSFDAQNIYAGCKVLIAKTHEVELYVNSRNLAENNDSDLSDRRRYYGAGFKTAL